MWNVPNMALVGFANAHPRTIERLLTAVSGNFHLLNFGSRCTQCIPTYERLNKYLGINLLVDFFYWEFHRTHILTHSLFRRLDWWHFSWWKYRINTWCWWGGDIAMHCNGWCWWGCCCFSGGWCWGQCWWSLVKINLSYIGKIFNRALVNICFCYCLL